MKPFEQLEVEVQMWLARRETVRASSLLLQYQAKEVEDALATAQKELQMARQPGEPELQTPVM